jgi:hypothetical protein
VEFRGVLDDVDVVVEQDAVAVRVPGGPSGE